IPFRQSHHISGSIVKMAEEKGVELDELSLEEMQKIEPRITSTILKVLSVENSVNSRISFGGTAKVRVQEQIEKAEKFLQL
ncbi:MAG: argininosuccinate lyase, partial [Rickettsiales bacterium]|nr:argininosuccinate lyase [Rickettsiales bacterium]